MPPTVRVRMVVKSERIVGVAVAQRPHAISGAAKYSLWWKHRPVTVDARPLGAYLITCGVEYPAFAILAVPVTQSGVCERNDGNTVRTHRSLGA